MVTGSNLNNLKPIAHYYSPAERLRVMKVASRQEQPDLVIRDCNVLSVNTMAFHHTNLLIAEGRIAAWDSEVEDGIRVIDAKGQFAVPGLLDAHTHVEAAMLMVEALAELIVPRGVTTLMADFHEIGNIFGGEGVSVLAKGALNVPLRLFLQVPAALNQDEAIELLQRPDSVSFGEASLPRILRDPEKYANMYALAYGYGRLVTGHGAGHAFGPWLSTLSALGHADDHECGTIEEAESRLLVGQKVMIREGSAARDLVNLIPLVLDHPEWVDQFMFCTDDRTVSDILERGHLDDCVRSAIQIGLAPELAFRMATLNTALHHHLEAHLGSLAPGRLADILLLDDLSHLLPTTVIVNGKIVAREGKPCWEKTTNSNFPKKYTKSVHINRSLNQEDIKLPLPEGQQVRVRILRMEKNKLHKYVDKEDITVQDGNVLDGINRDILKIIVVERHKGNMQIGLGLISGFGLKHGALASTISHDNHNLVVIGATDEDILLAVNAIIKIQGGLIVVDQGKVISSVSLPIAGLISLKGGPELASDLGMAEDAAHQLGCDLPAPFMTLSFASLIGIPEASITENGLVEAINYNNLPLQIK